MKVGEGHLTWFYHMTQKQTEVFFHSNIMHEMKKRNFKLEKK